jgi:bifunctional DNase/RNase
VFSVAQAEASATASGPRAFGVFSVAQAEASATAGGPRAFGVFSVALTDATATTSGPRAFEVVPAAVTVADGFDERRRSRQLITHRALRGTMDATIDAVRVAGTPDGPVGVVTLAVEESGDVLPISVGLEEAASIARGMDAADAGRPLTHDLLLDVVEELGGRVNEVVVSGVVEETFVADVHLDTPRDEAVVDARPSDSLALAARTGAAIRVEEPVFEEGRRPSEDFADLDDIRDVGRDDEDDEEDGP